MERKRSSRDQSDDSHKDRKGGRKFEEPEEESSNEQDNQVKVEVNDPKYKHRPLETFEDADFPRVFYDVIKKLGFVKPTPIQQNGKSYFSYSGGNPD